MALFGLEFSDPYEGFPSAFNSGDMQRQAFFSGLQQMGLGIMNPDPNVPPSMARTFGKAMSGFSGGVDQGRQDYEAQGLTKLKMQEYQEKQATKKRQNEALTGSLGDSELEPSLRNWIIANPDHAWDVIKPQFEKKDDYTLGEGQTRFDSSGNSLASVPKSPGKPEVLTLVSPDGKQRRSINTSNPANQGFVETYLQQGWVPAGDVPADPKAPNLVTVVSPDGKQQRSIDVTDPKARAFLQPYLSQGWTERGPASTSISIDTKGLSAEEQAAGKPRGERMDALESGASIKGFQQIQLAAKLLENVDTNALAGMKGKAGNIMVALGMPVSSLSYFGIDPNIITTGPEIQSLVNRSVMSMIGSGQFPAQNFSDTDRMFLEKIFPGLGNLPEANKLIGMTASRLMEVESKKRAAWAAARKQGQSFRDFEIAWNDQLQGQDIFGDIAAAAAHGGGAGAPSLDDIEKELRRRGLAQ